MQSKTARELYAPNPSDNRPLSERMNSILDLLVASFRLQSVEVQEQYLEGLGVADLLERGVISAPTVQVPEPDGLNDLAAQKYADSVRADSRLVGRLMRKAADGSSAQIDPEESLDDYFRRSAVEDFHKGFADCEYPQLAEAARAMALDELANQNTSVDVELEVRASLFRQAAQYRELEEVNNIARLVGGVDGLARLDSQPNNAHFSDDDVSPEVLRLNIGEEDGLDDGEGDDGESHDDYLRPRDRG